ncbi:hypothetical protein Tco_0974266 [Tanacetum coccineum]|uniref:KIB1-4 beta-propeller domain-containing protein n=1 Tax=Tanacetum coccineum TaxID=301880 RepID=A0ABQ5EB33_9ASTR
MDNDIIVRSVSGDEDESHSHLLSLPLHVLEVVMEFCVGVEYLKFRSTCKLCHSAAPLIQCNNGKASKLLHTCSLHSPWLMVFDEHKGIITYKDPMFGDNYFIKTPQQLICDFRIERSRYGWLLIIKHDDSMVFFNPFTSDIRELPELSYEARFCFSAPPTSPDCMVVALSTIFVFIYFVAGEPSWRRIYLDIDHDPLCSYRFLTLYGQDLYAISAADGGLAVFKDMGGEDYCWERSLSQAPKSCCTTLPESFQVRCDEHQSSASSFCIEAKIPEMENKIYFPRLSSESGNMVFYSLETCRTIV